MSNRLETILPQVPVEEIAIHIGKSGLSLGDNAEIRVLKDGRIGVFARVRHRILGLIPQWRLDYLGHLGPRAAQVLKPALAQDESFRLRIVVLTPEHLATSGPPAIHVSIRGNPHRLSAADIPLGPPPLGMARNDSTS